MARPCRRCGADAHDGRCDQNTGPGAVVRAPQVTPEREVPHLPEIPVPDVKVRLRYDEKRDRLVLLSGANTFLAQLSGDDAYKLALRILDAVDPEAAALLMENDDG